MVLIRSETLDDHNAVRRVIVDAFTGCEFGYNCEADIVDLLRNNCDDLLSLVAILGQEIVGYILFTPVSIRTATDQVDGMGLAPVAVSPNHQRRGIGTALINAGLEQLAAIRCRFVLVLGQPKYYPRFGFQLAAQYGVTHGFTGIPQEVFFIKILDRKVMQSIAKGTANFRDEFGPQRGSSINAGMPSA